jgi:alpha-beta hydrolase superfamily lysophospholipase
MVIKEKTDIIYTVHDAAGSKAVFLLVHGLGASVNRWEALSNYFAKAGFSSYALELKGFGRTKGEQGYIDSFNTYIKDILHLARIISKDHPGKKIFLLGESMGALIAFLTAIEHPAPFSGLVLISPAFTSKLKFKAIDYLAIAVSLLYNPKRRFRIPFNSKMCTRDAEYQRKLDSDASEHRIATARLLCEIIFAQVKSRMEKKKLKMPALFLVAESDKLVKPSDTKKIFKTLNIDDKKLIAYRGMRHALSIDIGKEKVFDDILSWTSGRF